MSSHQDRIRASLKRIERSEQCASRNWRKPDSGLSPIAFKKTLEPLFRLREDGELENFTQWSTWPRGVPLLPLLLVTPRLIVEFEPVKKEKFFAFYGVTVEQFTALAKARLILPSIYWYSDHTKNFDQHAAIMADYPEILSEAISWRINDIRRTTMLEGIGYPANEISPDVRQLLLQAVDLLDEESRYQLTQSRDREGALRGAERNWRYVEAFSQFQRPDGGKGLDRLASVNSQSDAIEKITLIWAAADHTTQYTSAFGQAIIVPAYEAARKLRKSFDGIKVESALEVFPVARFCQERLIEHWNLDLRGTTQGEWGSLREVEFNIYLSFLIEQRELIDKVSTMIRGMGSLVNSVGGPDEYYEKLGMLLSEAQRLKRISEAIGGFIGPAIRGAIQIFSFLCEPFSSGFRIVAGGAKIAISAAKPEGPLKKNLSELFDSAMGHQRRLVLGYDVQLRTYVEQKRSVERWLASETN